MENPAAVAVIVVYTIVTLFAAWVRFWTEPGFWSAVHTGRTFMLQASTLSIALGVSYLDQMRKGAVLRSYLPSPAPKPAEEALTSPLIHVLVIPELVFLFAVFFVFFYVMTGFNERNSLMFVGNPPHPRRFTNAVNQEPTRRYKIFISLCLWLGTVCLLIAFYCLGISHRRGMGWYLLWIAIPAHALVGLVLLIGPWLNRLVKGTDANTQNWDLPGLGGQKN